MQQVLCLQMALKDKSDWTANIIHTHLICSISLVSVKCAVSAGGVTGQVRSVRAHHKDRADAHAGCDASHPWPGVQWLRHAGLTTPFAEFRNSF